MESGSLYGLCKKFFDKERNKEAAAELQPALEPNSQSDNQTYQTVTIHSDFEHVDMGGVFNQR